MSLLSAFLVLDCQAQIGSQVTKHTSAIQHARAAAPSKHKVSQRASFNFTMTSGFCIVGS